MSQIFINIKELLQVRNPYERKVCGAQMNELPSIKNAYLWVENGLIKDYGSMDTVPEIAIEQIDCAERLILPTWCDSHTHLVFGDTREDEFVHRINGLTYEEIANKGGGILNSAKKLESITEDELYEKSLSRLQQAILRGTGAIEIKSGYGLSVGGELKLLRVIKRLKESSEIPIKATFLGAHAIPNAYKSNPEDYIDLIINKI